MGLIKNVLDFILKLNCRYKSKCCDCTVDFSTEEYQALIKEILKLGQLNSSRIFDFAEPIFLSSSLEEDGKDLSFLVNETPV